MTTRNLPTGSDLGLTLFDSVGSGEATAVERHAVRALRHLPGAEVSRTRDAIQLDSEGDDGITVLVTAEAVELRLPTIEWTHGAHGPERSSRLWKRVAWKKLDDDSLADLIDAALRVRQADLRPCRYCGDRIPPEHRFDDDTCHGCASEHLGVVY